MANTHIINRRAMQPVILFFAALLFASPAVNAAERENGYDVVGKALVPLARTIISPEGTKMRAFTLVLELESATNLPPDAKGQTLTIALQSPDKLRVDLQLPSGAVTVCRNSQEIWATPGSFINALLATQTLPKADPDFRLSKFTLPVTEKQLVLLPALFKVRDRGDEALGGENCMVLDLTFMPELAKSLKAEDWVARLWVRANYQVAKIELARPKWNIIATVKSLDYAPSLPPGTWQASAEEAQDVFKLTPVRYKQLLDLVVQQWTSFKAQAAAAH